MSFVLSYLNKKIAANMEDPKERDRKWEDRLRGVHTAAQKMRENMELPLKTKGFWRHEKHTAVYETNMDPSISNLPGRAKPKF